MGTSYQIICEDCKEYIYMGKIRAGTGWLLSERRTYNDITKITKEDWEDFDRVFVRSVLYFLIFQRQHYGHRVRVVSEYDHVWDMGTRDSFMTGYYGNAEALGFKKVCEPLLYDDECWETETQPCIGEGD